jgi:hypothetical protein
VKVDESLPWIELKRAYKTRREAVEAAERFLDRVQTKIVAIPEKKH